MTSKTTAKQILETAAGYVAGPRQESHGDKDLCFRCMDLADQLLMGFEQITRKRPAPGVTAALRMILYKMARVYAGGHNKDDYVDMAGYAACAGEVAAIIMEAEEGPINESDKLPE